MVSKKKEATSETNHENLGTMTIATFKNWPAEKRHGLDLAVKAALDVGKQLSDTVSFDGKDYVVGYTRSIIDHVNDNEKQEEDAKKGEGGDNKESKNDETPKAS